MNTTDNLRWATVVGLGLGAIGILTLWASGVEFPVYPPPGAVMLTVGAAFLAFATWRWSLAVGVVLGLFIIVGFVVSTIVSGTGTDLLSGDDGAGGVVGTIVELTGVAIATAAGVLGLRRVRSQALTEVS